MKQGDKYQHYKGGVYYFEGVALPLLGVGLSLETVNSMTCAGDVRHHENTRDITIYMLDGVYFIDSELTHVIYQSESDYGTDEYWAREVDDFFGYKQTDQGTLIKRFTLK